MNNVFREGDFTGFNLEDWQIQSLSPYVNRLIGERFKLGYIKECDAGKGITHDRKETSTHKILYFTESLEAKPKCEHKIVLAFGFAETLIDCDAQAHFEYCPKCGKELS